MRPKCLNCGKELDTDKDKHVMVETALGHSIMDQSYFHFKCWIEYFNKCVTNKISAAAGTAIGMLGQVMEKFQDERFSK